MTPRLATASAARFLGGSLCGGAILWWVATQAGPRDAEVLVHFVAPDTEARVDGRPCPAPDRPGYPVAVDGLSPGHHELTVHRDGRLMYREKFHVEAGESLVLIAFDGPGPAPDPPSPK